jgi:hypothetical protein
MSALIAVCVTASGANARVTTLTINNTQSAFSGASFGSVGTYELITGTFTDDVDPNDPHNSVITDIEHGPKNPNGTVSFTADWRTRLIGWVYDLPNRGGPGAIGSLNAGITATGTATGTAIAAGGNTAVPPSAGNAGTGFLMKMGWSVVEVGWDLTAPQGGPLFGVTLPVAKHRDGSAITGPTTEELVVDIGTTPADLPLTYPPASLDQSKAMLTVRENYGDAPQMVPAADWDYTTSRAAQTTFFSPTCVKLTAGNFGGPGTFGPTARSAAARPGMVGRQGGDEPLVAQKNALDRRIVEHDTPLLVAVEEVEFARPRQRLGQKRFCEIEPLVAADQVIDPPGVAFSRG